jgi:hypothetical protein
MIFVIDRICALWSKQTEDALDHHSLASSTALQVHRSDLARKRNCSALLPSSRQNEVVERNNGEKSPTFEGQNAG